MAISGLRSDLRSSPSSLANGIGFQRIVGQGQSELKKRATLLPERATEPPELSAALHRSSVDS